MVFEESPEVFWQRYLEHAASVELLPVPYGSPLLEALTPIGPVYAFDRGAPPAPVGRVNVIFAAAVESFRYRSGPARLQPAGGGRTLLAGKILRDLGGGAYLFDAGIPLVLHAAEPLESGAPLEVVAAPPLMLFREEV
ncbi:hypothetical protein [Oceanithermus sp.]